MPHYHFNVHNGELALDQHGMEFSGIEDARDEAIRRFGPSSRHWFEENRGWTVDITDASGGVLFSLHVFSAETSCLWPYHLSQYG